MAKTTITAGVAIIGGVDYSAQIGEIQLDLQADEVETTNMASGGYKEEIGGKKSGSVMFKFIRDADFSGLDAAMETALGTLVTVDVRFKTLTGEPKWTAYVLVKEWKPFGGSATALHENSVTFPFSGAWTRAIQ